MNRGKINEKDVVQLIEYRVVDWLKHHRRFGGPQTGKYINTRLIKNWFPGHLQGYVQEALDDLRKKGYTHEYKGGKTLALAADRRADIDSDLVRFHKRYHRLMENSRLFPYREPENVHEQGKP